MKPALARGELHCIGATTVEEYRRHIEQDGAFARRFQVPLGLGRLARPRVLLCKSVHALPCTPAINPNHSSSPWNCLHWLLPPAALPCLLPL